MKPIPLCVLICVVAECALTSCGGGGGSGGGAPASSGWTAGVFSPASNFQAQCVTPRSGNDPISGRPYPDTRGTVLTQNNWLRSWSNDLYLWYDEIVDHDPSLYTTANYFDLLKTTATTASGKPKDQFHFTLLTSDFEDFAQSGVSAGYGATWSLIAARPPRQIVVAYTDPGTPAVDPAVNLARGAMVLQVDGIDAVNDGTAAGVDALNAGLFPAAAGESHTFLVQDAGSASTRSVTMTSVDVTSTPVQNVHSVVTASGKVGYLLFNDHIATAEQELINAVNQLRADGIVDLVLDIRYNGGGFLDIASELAYMIAGNARTSGKTFESTVFNNKHPTTDPVTNQPLTPVPFHSTADGSFSAPVGTALPTLDLARLFVLTGSGTCSASESIINSLRGVGVNVIQIGSTTCGKPYGFYPQDNCGTTYFTVEFKGENNAGFGDYADGFSPNNTVTTPGVVLPGCSIGDDFGHALGDPQEARFAAALAYPSCPAPSGFVPPGTAALSLGESGDGVIHKPQWLQNKILRR